MKRLTTRDCFVLAFAASAVVITACSGGSGAGGVMPMAGSNVQHGAPIAANSHVRPHSPSGGGGGGGSTFDIPCPSGDTCGYIPIVALQYNASGSYFTEATNSWWYCWPGFSSSNEYTVPSASSGPLPMNAVLQLNPVCQSYGQGWERRIHAGAGPFNVAKRPFSPISSPPPPTPGPTPPAPPPDGGNGSLYIVAYQSTNSSQGSGGGCGWGDDCHDNGIHARPHDGWDGCGGDDDAGLAPGSVHPHHDGGGNGCVGAAVPIAGPSTIVNSQWTFFPVTYDVVGGDGYYFFVALRYELPAHNWHGGHDH